MNQYSSLGLFTLVLNFNLGVLIVILPSSVAKAGWLLSMIFLGIITLVSIITVHFLVEGITRAFIFSKSCSENDSSPFLYVNAEKPSEPTLLPLKQVIQINDALQVLFSNRAKVVYEVFFYFFEVAVLWNFGSVFTISFSSKVHLPFFSDDHCDFDTGLPSTSCLYQYYFWLSCFAFVVVFLSLKGMEEQLSVQMLLMFFRIVVIAAMCITSFIGIKTGKFGEEPIKNYEPIPSINFDGFGVLFGTAVLSQVIHHGIPSLVEPCKKKGSVHKVLSLALLCTGAMYCGVSYLGTKLFGRNIGPILSLRWMDYTAGHALTSAPLWTRVIAYTVTLFPPIDVVSAFPLGSVTLSNTLIAGHVKDNNKKKILLAKIASFLPPLLLVATRTHVSIISEIGGLVGFFICFIIPAVMVIKSRKMCRNKGIIVTTHYSLFKSLFVPYLTILIGFGAFFWSVVLLIKELFV
ncbi:hypothetical protein RCL1_006086 [Eukaryota sp. TZLM3-RCL]